MNFQEFIQQINRKKIAPIYLFTGEEPFLIQSALEQLTEQALDPSARDFNYVQINGRESSPQNILNEVQSHPVFSSRRLVVIKNAETIPANEANQLVGYLNDPSPTTCLVFVADKFDTRRTFFKVLTQNHPVVNCQPLSEARLPAWILNHARSLKYDLTEDAVLFLVDQIGSDLFKLHNEIVKAGLLVERYQPITRKTVQQTCGAGGQWAVPDLLQAVGKQDQEQAVLILKKLLELGEPPLVILAAIARQFRQAIKVKQLLRNHYPESAIPKRLGIWRTNWPNILQQTKTYAYEDLQWSFRRIMETDAGMKGSALPNFILMELLVLDLCRGRENSLRRFLGGSQLVYLESET